MKKNGVRKILLGLLLFFMIAILSFTFFKHTCVDSYAQIGCSISTVEGESLSECCMQYVTVWVKLGAAEIFWTILIILLIDGLFFIFFKKFLNTFSRDFRKKNIYGKIFFVELGLILLASFFWFSLWVAAYDGTSCLLDNCTNMSFIQYFSFWGIMIGVAGLMNPISLVILISPYVLVFIYSKISPKGTRPK